MRVGLITNDSSIGITGLSRYSSILYQELQKTKIDIELVRPSVPFSHSLGLLGRRLGIDPVTFLSNYPVMIEQKPVDIYHLSSENLASILMFSRIKPVVVTVHAFFTYFLRNDAKLAMYNHSIHQAFDFLAAKGLQRADAIIAVSNYVADLVIDKLAIPSNRVHVIHEAVDHQVFRPLEVPDMFRDKYGIDPGYFYFLYVGSEQPRKNFPMLLRAFARIRAKYDRVRLLKIGAPELQVERDLAKKLIRELNIEDDVIFLGHVGDELPLFYNATDVFVFPSLYEGFGFPPLEAMACGKPTVCSNTTSLPEVVGDAAMSFNPNDEEALVAAMEIMYSCPETRAFFGAKGLVQARKFQWDPVAAQTKSLYETLVGEVKPNRRRA
ncbi:MAG: glycosyltransferase family 4 protein [Anaerolinea sp.]|nr:glycosyltransferase family 4 protein [Anaerolinea sp.]